MLGGGSCGCGLGWCGGGGEGGLGWVSGHFDGYLDGFRIVL